MARKGITKGVRDYIKNKHNGRCGYCGCEPIIMHIDHIKPVSAGGTDDVDNLMPSCAQCNNFKSSSSLETFRNELQQQVIRAEKYSVNFRMAKKFGLIVFVDKPIKFYFENNL